MSDDPDTRPNAQPIFEFEGEYVRQMEGKLPQLTLDMPEGYPRGTHLMLGVEVRVRNVRMEEDRKGDLTRQHIFALEEIKLLEAFDPAQRPTNVGGSSASDAWVQPVVRFLNGDVDELDFEGEEIPDRLHDMLKLYFERQRVDEETAFAARLEATEGHDDEVGF